MASRDLNNDETFEFFRGFLEFYCRWLRPQSYLEIGLAGGETFRRLIPYCNQLTGVDPALPDLGNLNSKCRLIRLTSDEYFRDFPEDTYDLVFIDGNHESKQVMRDIRNALACLRSDGLIVAHDTFPPSPDFTNPQACGDAYTAIIELRKDRSLEVYTFPVRYGVTLIGKIGTAFPWTALNARLSMEAGQKPPKPPNQDFTILIPSHRPHLAQAVELSLAPLPVVRLNGSGYPSFAKLMNDCIVRSSTEVVVICSDKVTPSPDHIQRLCSLLEKGYALVGLYYFACFGFTKQLIRQMGFFDERFIGGEFEDADMMIRMREANLAYYLSKEVPYKTMPSSWNNTLSRGHFIRKWGSIHMREATRLLPEEQYPYDLGPSKPKEFLPSSASVEET